ncbi:HDIG domain-containing metalloprotein [Chloroflexota bacterium]
MNREDALKAIRENVSNENLIKHMLATEALMEALAGRLGEDKAEWGLAGLIHDIDVELTEGDMTRHGHLGADIIRKMEVDEKIVHAVMAHNETLGITRETTLDKALFCADPLTGLITATALVMPDRKLATVKAKSVSKRFKAKAFAAGANRENMATCSELGLELDEFIEIGLKAMQGVAEELGL